MGAALARSDSGPQETHRPGAQRERLGRTDALSSLLAPSKFRWSSSPSVPSEPLITGKGILQRVSPWSWGSKTPYPYLRLCLQR